MKRQILTGFENYGKRTRRAQFLADMDKIVPWPEPAAAVQTVYPKISENDNSIKLNDLLARRGPTEQNPDVRGQDAVRRFFAAYGECAQTFKAQMAP